ncbi:hypothetical protein AK95_06565 [Paenibacillus sp. LC231]|nr:hypothetical protein AK95_06565 [Paenibacillus sp. LC231]
MTMNRIRARSILSNFELHVSNDNRFSSYHKYNVRLRRNDNFTREITIPFFFSYVHYIKRAVSLAFHLFPAASWQGNGSQNHINCKCNIASSTFNTNPKAEGNKKTFTSFIGDKGSILSEIAERYVRATK